MMIPILLISTVLYAQNNTIITGAVTAQEKQTNILGTYSIMPSFKARIDYNLKGEYNSIKEQISSVINECQAAENTEQCLQEKANEPKWVCNDLKDDVSDILYDFIDKISECINLEENNAVCRFSLDERDLLTPINSFDIILTNENQRTKVESRQGTKSKADYIDLESLGYVNDYNNKNTLSKSANPIKFIIEYQNGKPQISRAVATDNTVPVELSKLFMFYKTNGNIRFVESTQDGSFRAPPPANKIIDVPRFKGFKFCAKTGAKIYAYDESDKTVKQRDIVYKFAVKYQK